MRSGEKRIRTFILFSSLWSQTKFTGTIFDSARSTAWFSGSHAGRLSFSARSLIFSPPSLHCSDWNGILSMGFNVSPGLCIRVPVFIFNPTRSQHYLTFCWNFISCRCNYLKELMCEESRIRTCKASLSCFGHWPISKWVSQTVLTSLPGRLTNSAISSFAGLSRLSEISSRMLFRIIPSRHVGIAIMTVPWSQHVKRYVSLRSCLLRYCLSYSHL